jgi:hypothetical protein
MFAYKLQHPNIKINHAILLGGDPGSGKDTLLAPLIRAICGKGTRNLAMVNGKSFEGNFNYHFECEIMLLSEIRADQSKDRRALENTLKPVIAAPPEYLPVNRKGLHPYDALNRILVIAMSNFRDAIALPADDRRWYVLWTYAAPMNPDKAKKLWRWYEQGGFEAIAAFLMQRDVSAFNPGAAPPMTEAKSIMLQETLSTAEAYIFGLIDNRAGVFANGAIGSPMQGVLDRISIGSPANVKLTTEALSIALKQAKWLDRGKVRSREHNISKQCYCAPELKDRSASYLRNLLETPVPGMALVK